MGKPRNTQKYPTYPEIPEIPGNTRKKKRYPEIPDRIFWHSYPTRTRPATRYFVQYPTRPDPILKNPTRWALVLRKVIQRHFKGHEKKFWMTKHIFYIILYLERGSYDAKSPNHNFLSDLREDIIFWKLPGQRILGSKVFNLIGWFWGAKNLSWPWTQTEP